MCQKGGSVCILEEFVDLSRRFGIPAAVCSKSEELKCCGEYNVSHIWAEVPFVDLLTKENDAKAGLAGSQHPVTLLGFDPNQLQEQGLRCLQP